MAYPSGLSISSCDNNLVDERQAAAILDLRVATLRRWRYSGDGPEYIKLGAAVMAAIEVLSIRAITGAGNLRGIARFGSARLSSTAGV